MINLYQILNIPPHANTSQIQAALQRMQAGLDAKTIKAINEWLLVPDVRVRYDAKLRQEQPDFFMMQTTAAPAKPAPNKRQEKPKIVLSNSDTEDDDDYMDLPPLWNPKAAMWWSLLFSVAFGAFLHAKNWEALGEKQLAKQNWFWFFGILIAAVVLSFFDIQVGSIVLLVVWYYTLGKKQVEFFAHEFDDDYERKGWLLPIFLAFIVNAIFVSMIIFLMISMGTIGH